MVVHQSANGHMDIVERACQLYFRARITRSVPSPRELSQQLSIPYPPCSSGTDGLFHVSRPLSAPDISQAMQSAWMRWTAGGQFTLPRATDTSHNKLIDLVGQSDATAEC